MGTDPCVPMPLTEAQSLGHGAPADQKRLRTWAILSAQRRRWSLKPWHQETHTLRTLPLLAGQVDLQLAQEPHRLEWGCNHDHPLEL